MTARIKLLLPRSGISCAALFAVLVFAFLVARFWQPVYGFTAFLQLDWSNDTTKIAAFHAQPVYVYRHTGGYDGEYYAQIAYDPTLRSPELLVATDNLAYRGRRILAPALAWALALGQERWIVHVYSVLNLFAWLALAALAWRLLAVHDARSLLAWTGLLFSAGALHSVRLALTDLIGLAIFAGAMLARERSRPGLATALLAAAGLARETSLAALPGLWTDPRHGPRAWLTNVLRSIVVVAPLALWILYIHHRLPALGQNVSVWTMPGVGLAEKLRDSVAALKGANDPLLMWSTLLATIGLMVQAGYLMFRPRWNEPWWWAGIPFAVMMLLLNQPVWVDHPGAITRVLLPLQLAFNVLAVRHRAALALILAGNLGLFSGLAAFRAPMFGSGELAHGRTGETVVVARAGTGWYPSESTWRHVRTWGRPQSRVDLEAWPHDRDAVVQLAFDLRGYTPCTVAISQDGHPLWSGPVTTQKQHVVLPAVNVSHGVASVEFSSDHPGALESDQPGARALSFALYDLQVSPSPAPARP